MNQAQEHFIFVNEAVYGTFVAPSKALPIISCGLNGAFTVSTPDLTGYGRDQGVAFPLEKQVKGPLQLLAHPNYIASLLKAFMTAVTTTRCGATAAYRHKLLNDDTAALGSLSMELQRDTTQALFAKGVKIAGVTLSCKAKEAALLTFDLVGEDTAYAGGTWSSTGVAAPAAPTTPVPYPATLQMPFKFSQGQLLYGGTPSVSSGEITVAGGAAVAYVNAVEIKIAVGQGENWVVNNKPTIGNYREEGRQISCKLDLDFVGAGRTYTDYVLAGTEGVLQLNFVGRKIVTGPPDYYEEMCITLPRVYPMTDTLPAVQGSKARRVQTVMYKGLRHLTLNHSISWAIQNEETTI